MKIEVDTQAMQNAINKVQKGISSKTTLPILEGIYIKAEDNMVTLIGTDMDLTIMTQIEANVIDEGETVVNSRIFSDIVRTMPRETISMDVENNVVTLKSGSSLFNISCYDSEEYPAIPTIELDYGVVMDQEILNDMIKGTIFSVSTDMTHPILNGSLLKISNDEAIMVALDGYRMSIKRKKIQNNSDLNIVIPYKALNELSRLLEEGNLNIYVNRNQAVFDMDNTRVYTRLLEGEFIDYENIIPNEKSLVCEVKREDIVDTLERASLISKDRRTLVKLTIDGDYMKVEGRDERGYFNDVINIKIDGPGLTIAFNSLYLLEALRAIEDSYVKLEFLSNVSPCIIKPVNGDDYLYLVLPVKMKDDSDA
ncbi:DNA polymerase III subunit beta [Calorimonas adulescens]|jgi:DNA polymerase III, beta subunit|uniref:Beta sliding clamp n=1 Tax=Calorimonas adulescens TaxID=2606906 RepID=A0A5D8QAG2_9THEO|nr:DNA polymerase III subunit beta [Calorimonas adulescens]TZE80766.1 DNA polymerase III subunit beta [Calorimonas adulescens]